MENEPRAKRRANEVGPSGRRVADNLESIREQRRLSQDELAALTGRLGRPMTRQIVSKTEIGDRRVDVDDLVAFAVALDTTPNRLLLTAGAIEGETVELVPGMSVSQLDAWRWASGEQPLDICADHAASHQLRFVQESMPHHSGAESARRRREVADLLARDGELARIVAVVVDEAARRGLDHGTLLEVVSHMHVQARFERGPRSGKAD